MQNMIPSIKKKNPGKKITLITNANNKSLSSIHSSLPTHSTIANNIHASSKKPTYFSSSFSTHGESNSYSLFYLENEEMSLKEGFNTSL